MRKIDKSPATIVSTKYKEWIDKLKPPHDGNYRYYYDDVIMNLFKCQGGVCAYTEMYICIPALYKDDRWAKGRYLKKQTDPTTTKKDHLAELEHFDPLDKKDKYWNWDNLFMIHSTINERKSGTNPISKIKPDLADYSPDKYFEYDDITHRFIPNQNIEDEKLLGEIWHMINNVLFLNHGVVIRYRKNYIEDLRLKQSWGLPVKLDEFFTSVKMALGVE